MTTQTLRFPFDDGKALEATAAVLRLAGGVLDVFHVVKCLYFAERASILRRGRPIFGGYYASMKDGPVPKDVYTRVSPLGSSQGWRDFISRDSDGDNVYLVRDVPAHLLSESEVGLLRDSYAKYGVMPFPELWRLAHDGEYTPEYEKPEDGREKPLTADAILRAQKRSEAQIEQIRIRAKDDEAFDRLLPNTPT